jgi:HSP20 family protein
MIIKQTNRNFNHVFDEIFNAFPTTWGSDNRTESIVPPVNIHETPEAYHIELNAPGRNKEDFKINVEKNILTVSFDRQKEEEKKDYKTLKREFSFPGFKRSFSVDEKINTDEILARYENGILKVLLPKKEEVKISPKQIQIQ